MRIIAPKSARLAAQNYMTLIPMKGFDLLRIKKILHLPARPEINLILGCGIRDEQGIYGERFCVPFEEVY